MIQAQLAAQKPSPLYRHMITIGTIGTVILTFLITLVTFWMAWPYKTIIFLDPQFPILSSTITNGGVVKFTSKYCKYVHLTEAVSRNYVNDIVFSMPQVTTNREYGCHTITVQVQVPPELPPGTYHLEINYIYKINPVREIIVHHRTDNFVVHERKGGFYETN